MSATSRLTPVASDGPNIKLAPRPLEHDLMNHDTEPPVNSGVRLQFASGKGRGQYQTFMFWLLRGVAACNVMALLAVCAFLLQNGLPALSALSPRPRCCCAVCCLAWPC